MDYEERRRVSRAFHGEVLGEMWRRAPDLNVDLWAASYRGRSLVFTWALEGRMWEASHHAIDHKDQSPDRVAAKWLTVLGGGKVLRRDCGTPPPWDDESQDHRQTQGDLLAELLSPEGESASHSAALTWVGISRQYRPTAVVLRYEYLKGGSTYQWVVPAADAVRLQAADIGLEMDEGVWQAVPISQLS